jgi:tRNA (guanine-N7-)-methyltransferase
MSEQPKKPLSDDLKTVETIQRTKASTKESKNLDDIQYKREVRSFVLRAGRVTNAQQACMDSHWPLWGLTLEHGLLDFAEVFGNSNPVVLEVGFGMGKSLVEQAQQNPDMNFVGIEVHTPGIGACLKSAIEAGVENIRIFHEDAIKVFRQCIPNQSIARMQLFFPDPWHKKKHHKRRIVQPEFAKMLHEKLVLGGVFHMATDWENYADHMRDIMNAAPGYKNLSADQTFVEKPDFRPNTKFEARGERLGHGVWDLIFEKVDYN